MMIPAAAAEGIFQLKDGRSIAYAEYGVPDGRPVMYFQGTPSSRLMHPPDEVTRDLGARLIVIDRPGFGRSDPSPGRTLCDWPNDVAQLLNHLGIGDFATVGVSGGGPYVLATAFCLPDRVRAAGVCGGSGPLEVPGALQGAALVRRCAYLLARHWPSGFRWVMRRTTNPRPETEKFARKYTRHNPPADQSIFADAEFHAMYIANLAEATRQGVDGFADEVILGARPWGFRLQDIRVPVQLWHGDRDNSTPLGMAKGIAALIPSAKLTVLPGQGHMFIFGPLWRRILAELLAST